MEYEGNLHIHALELCVGWCEWFCICTNVYRHTHTHTLGARSHAYSRNTHTHRIREVHAWRFATQYVCECPIYPLSNTHHNTEFVHTNEQNWLWSMNEHDRTTLCGVYIYIYSQSMGQKCDNYYLWPRSGSCKNDKNECVKKRNI